SSSSGMDWVSPSRTRPAASVRLEIDSTDLPPTRSICRPIRGPSRAEITGDGIGEHRGQIIARGPGQRLRGAERQNDRKLPGAHRFVAFLSCLVVPAFAAV